ncbi:hypothetical protein SOASR030_04620 [Leminorella grimontii]|uniref:Uncharacterized protein n=1 Tax=Leminorella grimontii TaxID=82981 RepID=A0AAV5MYG2_9GAMM|nr:hypothetical protein SOASR030_04620 [Leminorella grimontii]
MSGKAGKVNPVQFTTHEIDRFVGGSIFYLPEAALWLLPQPKLTRYFLSF